MKLWNFFLTAMVAVLTIFTWMSTEAEAQTCRGKFDRATGQLECTGRVIEHWFSVRVDGCIEEHAKVPQGIKHLVMSMGEYCPVGDGRYVKRSGNGQYATTMTTDLLPIAVQSLLRTAGDAYLQNNAPGCSNCGGSGSVIINDIAATAGAGARAVNKDRSSVDIRQGAGAGKPRQHQPGGGGGGKANNASAW